MTAGRFEDVQRIGENAMALLDELSRCSRPGPGVTRLPFTLEHEQALTRLAEHMQRIGLQVHRDEAVTLIGSRQANDVRQDEAAKNRVLFLGSHQDSIVNGGRYDGILGIVVPLLAIELLTGDHLPFTIQLLCFADEEGVRFPTALLGPRALAGTLDPEVLALVDRDGVSLGHALDSFGGDPAALMQLRRHPADALGYLEVHIEQGPVLEQAGRSLGVVTGICGIERWSVTVSGKSAHAGTTPMSMRLDALTGASEMILAVERRCRDTDGLVGVVGQLNVEPGVVNAVPGEVYFTVELRAADDTVRQWAAELIGDQLDAIAAGRGLVLARQRTYSQTGVLCDSTLQSVLAKAVAAVESGSVAAVERGGAPVRLMSGATHDASAMSDLCPVGMLFVRCRDGISHHPDESVTAEDCGRAVIALAEAIRELAVRQPSPAD